MNEKNKNKNLLSTFFIIDDFVADTKYLKTD